jgi:DUF3073 family protein
MGRGRAKAKQTKVARELKYSTRQTDFDALQRELSSGASEGGGGAEALDDDDGPYEDDDYRR